MHVKETKRMKIKQISSLNFLGIEMNPMNSCNE